MQIETISFPYQTNFFHSPHNCSLIFSKLTYIYAVFFSPFSNTIFLFIHFSSAKSIVCSPTNSCPNLNFPKSFFWLMDFAHNYILTVLLLAYVKVEMN